jgi:exosortase
MSRAAAPENMLSEESNAGAAGAWNQTHNLIFIGMISLALVGLFYRWFMKQSQFSMHQIEDWGHAFFVPLIAGYLVWQRRHEIAKATPKIFWPGMLAVLTGILGYFTFSIGPIPGVHMGQGLFVILTIWGVALMLLGPAVVRWLMMPTAYLVFMITVSEAVMLKITWPLQLLASQGAYIMLGLLGMATDFTVSVDGNVLTVINSEGAEYPLNVAEACSGMRMIVAFIALAGAVALLSANEWWKRITLLLLSIPVALLMNIVRVAVLGLATLGDADLAQGEAHTLIGTLLLVPGLGLFLAVGWALEKIAPAIKPEKTSKKPVPMRLELKRSATAILLVVLFGSALGMGWAISYYKYHLDKLPIYAPGNRSVATLPVETESWVQVGTDKIMSAEVLEELGTSNYLSRTYRQKNPPEGSEPQVLELHAAYYTDQIDTVPHVPERCFVGAGMTPTGGSVEILLETDQGKWSKDEAASTESATIYTDRTSTRWSDGRGKRVRLPQGIENARLRTSEYHNPGGRSLYAGYFFIANGGVASSAEQVRMLAFNLENDYAFYLKVQFTTATAASREEFVGASSDLLSEVLADIMLCAPDWVEVQAGRYPSQNESISTGAGG